MNHEERVAEVERHIAKKEHQEGLRQARIVAVSGVAACLAIIIDVSLFMPGIMEQTELGTSFGFETAATIFGGGATLGYIVIGLPAFTFGVCVTILCFQIRLLNKKEQVEEQRGDNADGTCQ